MPPQKAKNEQQNDEARQLARRREEKRLADQRAAEVLNARDVTRQLSAQMAEEARKAAGRRSARASWSSIGKAMLVLIVIALLVFLALTFLRPG